MTNKIKACLTGFFLAMLTGAVAAQELPRSGSIKWHTGWRLAGETLDVAEGHVQGHGSVVGTSFNDSGSGPLHLGPAECVYTFYSNGEKVTDKGYCAFGDADGDRIFTDWTGNGKDGTSGVNVIVGGTGKYEGITGKGPWFNSGGTGKNGGWKTFQRLDYRLP
ncbi:MAG: hypothetical protein JSU95_07945 [Betaproteobacteria bacterium]|nr:MAG: hypothetical protein JSU95_07945 [Betaproteobacteria bacterium]